MFEWTQCSLPALSYKDPHIRELMLLYFARPGGLQLQLDFLAYLQMNLSSLCSVTWLALTFLGHILCPSILCTPHFIIFQCLVVLRGLSPGRSFFPFGRWPACLPWILGISCLSLNSVTSFRVYLRVNSCLLAFSGLPWTLDIDIWALPHFLSVYVFSSLAVCPGIGSLLSALHICLSFDRRCLLVFLPAVWFLSHLYPSVSLTPFSIVLILSLDACNVAFISVTLLVFYLFLP